ncbi:chemokine-like receptor 1 [Esox lucius]|uniref:chemokine-like receptor 1 n=1 Tax=Esox lucius TaxID=8010 RepID=UPI0014769B42|nr:chemokine-like receptor 1 [Esox lucius]
MEDYYIFPLIKHNICFSDFFSISNLLVNFFNFLVGVLGNGLVIWITGLKMKKTVKTTWYLSLAVSDFIFCVAYPPFYIIFIVRKECIFGLFMCNFTIALMYITLYSSVFLLVIISVDHCLSVVFPVWSQTNRTIDKASIVVILTWVLSVALSTRFNFTGRTQVFIVGFVVPFLIIIFCYFCVTFILRLRTRQMMSVSSKPFRVMIVLIAMFFICWLPLHVFILLDQNDAFKNAFNKTFKPEPYITSGLSVGVILATVHSFLRPVLYVCMGNNVPPTLKRSIIDRIENVLGEEDSHTTSHETSLKLFEDDKASGAVEHSVISNA